MPGENGHGTARGRIIGVDIGGTFTDAIVLDSGGRVVIGKASSTPPDFEQGFIDSVAAVAERLGIGLRELLAGADGVFHGCTVGTNALVENRAAKVGVITTRGHRDSLFMMQGGGRFVGLSPETVAHVAVQRKPEPLVAKDLVVEVDERVGFDGQVVVELNLDGARTAISRLLEQGVESFAVSLLWSIVNPAHEQAIAELLAELAPTAFVSTASSLISRSGEYERTVATVMNSLIGPVMQRYLGALQDRLRSEGYTRTLQLMSCSGGLMDAAYARERPFLTIGSGPVAGLIGAANLSRASSTGSDSVDVITADMGGTTFDVGVIRHGQPLSRTTTRLGQYEYFVPTLDVRSVGAGGGSLIRYDEGRGTLRVGPQSAGSRPGPAAFGRGGTEATVTDADLVLGYLNPDYFLGGAMALDRAAAAAALTRAGAPMGFDAERTAAAAAQIVDSQMADAIRLASVQQGYDPREHTLYAYGGGGPVHATALARELGVTRVVIPLSDLASGWSAFGVVSSDAVVVEDLPLVMNHPFDPASLNDGFGVLEQRVWEVLDRQGITRAAVQLDRSADIRYGVQINNVSVALPSGSYTGDHMRRLVEDFEAEYARLFGADTGYAAAGFVMSSIRLQARAPLSDYRIVPGSGGNGDHRHPPQKGERGVIFYERGGDRVTTPIYDGAGFGAGMVVSGPAIVEFPDTTLVLRERETATVDGLGSVVVELAG
jgi:N-methylhydantoinase A